MHCDERPPRLAARILCVPCAAATPRLRYQMVPPPVPPHDVVSCLLAMHAHASCRHFTPRVHDGGGVSNAVDSCVRSSRAAHRGRRVVHRGMHARLRAAALEERSARGVCAYAACMRAYERRLLRSTPLEPRMYPAPEGKNLILYRLEGRSSAALSFCHVLPPSVEPKMVPPPPTAQPVLPG